jgi:DNA-binding beta-propeller fold protein YncE
VAVLGGREGVPRSLGSVYGGSVTRFLSGGLRGAVSRTIATGVPSYCGIAMSRDGSTLLVSHNTTLLEIRVADGTRLRGGGVCNDPQKFKQPHQVWIAADDFAFIVDYPNNYVRVLTPTHDVHADVGVGQLSFPAGVCANADVVLVSEADSDRVSVFKRCDGALVRRFGFRGPSSSRLRFPCGLCLVSGDRHVAVADNGNDRVAVFSVGGDFIRDVGNGVLRHPRAVACSAFDELVVADTGNNRVVLFSGGGELLKSMGHGIFTGVVVHGGAIYAHDSGSRQCVVFK